MLWTQRDGTKIDIHEMSDAHLRNSIAQLRRNGFIGEDEYLLALGAAFSFSSGMASYYAEQSIGDIKVSVALDAMEAELERRS